MTGIFSGNRGSVSVHEAWQGRCSRQSPHLFDSFSFAPNWRSRTKNAVGGSRPCSLILDRMCRLNHLIGPLAFSPKQEGRSFVIGVMAPNRLEKRAIIRTPTLFPDTSTHRCPRYSCQAFFGSGTSQIRPRASACPAVRLDRVTRCLRRSYRRQPPTSSQW